MAKPTIGTKKNDEFYQYSFGQRFSGAAWRDSGEDGWGVALWYFKQRSTSEKEKFFKSVPAFQTEIDGYPVTNMDGLFSGFNPKVMNVSAIKVDKIKSMSGALESNNKTRHILGLEKWDTSNVEDMSFLFSGARNVEGLDVSHFNTSNVTNMHAMFANCCKVEVLDTSGFDTSKVTDMRLMFNDCSCLDKII